MEKNFEREILETIKKHIVLIIIVSLIIGGGICAYKKYSDQDVYVVKTEIAVSDGLGENGSYNDVRKSRALVGFYSKLATSSVVIQQTKEDINFDGSLSDIKSMVTVTEDKDSQYLEIEVRNSDEAVAGNVADALVQNLKKYGNEIRNEDLLTIITYPKDDITVEHVDYIKCFAAGFLGGIMVLILVFYFFIDQKKVNEKK